MTHPAPIRAILAMQFTNHCDFQMDHDFPIFFPSQLGIPDLVNIQKTNWKDPPCYFYGKPHELNGGSFHSYVSTQHGIICLVDFSIDSIWIAWMGAQLSRSFEVARLLERLTAAESEKRWMGCRRKSGDLKMGFSLW